MIEKPITRIDASAGTEWPPGLLSMTPISGTTPSIPNGAGATPAASAARVQWCGPMTVFTITIADQTFDKKSAEVQYIAGSRFAKAEIDRCQGTSRLAYVEERMRPERRTHNLVLVPRQAEARR